MMAFIYHHSLISCALLLFIMLISSSSITRVDSLGIKMIRKDTIESPLFPKNLTLAERHKRLLHLSHSRARYLITRSSLKLARNKAAALFNSSTTGLGTDTIQPMIGVLASSLYVVLLSVGSQQYNTFLDIDTGSDLTWVQCKGCQDCFELKGGPFDHEASSSYVALPYNQGYPIKCEMAVGNLCGFKMEYVDDDSLSGILSNDTFTFLSETGLAQSVPNIVFGCATEAKVSWQGNTGPENVISGIFGLAKDENRPISFLQSTTSITKNRFSYCLPYWDEPKGTHGFLKFGDDVFIPQGTQYSSTPLINDEFFVNLLDISINGVHLNLDPTWFVLKQGGRDGFLIDSGSSHTVLAPQPYQVVKDGFISYFASYGMRPIVPPPGSLEDLCFLVKETPKHMPFPTMTYHFKGADLVLDFWRVFQLKTLSVYCWWLTSIEEGGPNMLGSYQQTNTRFVFDLNLKYLYFYPQECINV